MSEANGETTRSRDCVLVLGMHRSGTSALAGVLSLLGCSIPVDLASADENNGKGYFESRATWGLNDELLADFDSGWDDWTPIRLDALDCQTMDALRVQAGQIIDEEFPDKALFVMKDPRMCRVAPLWLDALRNVGCTPHIIHTHRNPHEVAASLARRDGFVPAFSLLMWLRHVLDAEISTRGQPRVFTSYRLLMLDWRALIDRLGDELGLFLPNQDKEADKSVKKFLSERLRHFHKPADVTIADPALPEDLRDTFAIMERWAEAGEEAGDYGRLDRIREKLDADATAFAPLVRPGQMALLAENRLGDELEALKQEQAAVVEQIASLNEALEKTREDATAQVTALNEALVMAQDDAAAQGLALSEANGLIELLRTDLSDRNTLNRMLQGDLDQTRADNAQLHHSAAQIEHDYHAILNSTSWRLTEPLRRVTRFVRRR